MSRLQLLLLGAFQLIREERPATFRSEKERALLAYLAVEAFRPHSRDALAGLFWPELPDETAHNNLRVTLHRLRTAIGDPHASQPLLDITRETIQLNPAAQLWLDVTAFEALIACVGQHIHARLATCPECTAWYAEAVAIYQGDFLRGFDPANSLPFSEWALLKREHLHNEALRALFHLAESYRRRGELEPALNYARRQLELEPWREEAHRQVIATLARLGERSAALRQYERCRQVLVEELGVEPSEETRALYQRILASRRKELHNLPKLVTPFVGRRQELNQIGDLLADPDCRLLTILGPGGVGKSRLAIQAAEAHAISYLHGVTLVQLGGLNSAEELIPALARSLEYQVPLRGDPKTQLLEYLREREILLLLDTYEHLQGRMEEPSVLGFIQELLEKAQDVKVLVTSHHRLDLRQEWLYPLAGLDIPEVGDAAEIQKYGAVQLFLACAHRASPGFSLESAEEPVLVRICQVLGGLPLAIELAAAWIRVMPVAQILQEIQDSLDFLASSFPDLPARHRSLRATFQYSWSLLTSKEKDVLGRLSVFPASFTQTAAGQVAGSNPSVLNSLVDKSLLTIKPGGKGLRYSLHDVIRQFAGEELALDPIEAETVKDLHRSFFMNYLGEREGCVMGSQVQHQVVDQVQEEIENISWALERAIEQARIEELSRCFNILMFYYEIKGPPLVAERLFGRIHQVFEAADQSSSLADLGLSHTLIKSILYHAWYCMRMMRLDQAEVLNQRGLALARQTDDWLNQGGALNSLGIIARFREDFQQARNYLLEAIAVFEKHNHIWWYAGVLGNLGLVDTMLGDLIGPQGLFEESLALFTQCGDRWGVAGNFEDLGVLALRLEELDRAEEYFRKGLKTRREIGQKWRTAFPLRMLAEVAFRRSDHLKARNILKESLSIVRESGERRQLAFTLLTYGEVCTALGEHQEAKESFLEAMQIAGEMGLESTYGKAERILLELIEKGDKKSRRVPPGFESPQLRL